MGTVATLKTIDELVANINPRAKVPHGFGFWSDKMQLTWLRQNQKKVKERKEK